MALFVTLLALFSPLFAAFPADASGRILYLAHHNQVEQAITHYLDKIQEGEEHDFALLQSVGQTILERGTQSGDPQTQLYCLFGAGVAHSPQLIPVLEKGIRSAEMKNQLIALNFLSRYQDDSADQLLTDALSSPYLLTRLEACYQLAQKRNPIVIDHLHALYYKVPPVVRTLFPQIVAHIDSAEANQMMQHYLSDSDFLVRTEALIHIAKHKRDDFLPRVHALAKEAHFVQQEAAALCFGAMRDRSALSLLEKMAQAKQEEVQLTALLALHSLGEEGVLKTLIARARSGNLFAITALGAIDTTEVRALLTTLSKSSERDITLNAALALLRLRDPASLPPLRALFAAERQDLGFYPQTSPAGALHAWRVTGSTTQKESRRMGLRAQTERLKYEVLQEALELPEESFLPFARALFEQGERSLIPPLVEMLANHRTPAALALLKEMQQKTGAPFVRNYCTLALFRIGEKGPYEEKLIAWVKEQENTHLIQLKEEKAYERQTAYALSAEEHSRFYIEALEALCSAQSVRGVETLIHTIAYGNPQNRYALAGLLIRTAE